MDTVLGLFLLLGGIGLFLFGINFLSIHLQQAADNKLRVTLEKMTSNGFFALLTGAGLTALIQSSGATSVLAVGFVDAGLMNLQQALYTMLGANIGTTITAQIIAFKIDTIAPLILFVGVIMYQFVKKSKLVKRIGAIVLGFGLLFVGIYLMGLSVKQLNLGVLIQGFLTRFNNPILSVLFGVVFTAVIQSSSASIGILQVLLAESALNGMGLESVVYMVMGMNIGACSPVVISSFAGGRNCRCAAFSDVLAKIVGTLAFSLLIIIFPSLLERIAAISPSDVARQIANLHLIFNIFSAVLVFPFVKLMSRLINMVFPDKAADDPAELSLKYISRDKVLHDPLPVATTKLRQEVLRMADLTRDNVHRAVDGFFAMDVDSVDEVLRVEKTIDFLNHEIAAAVVELNGRRLPGDENDIAGMMFRVVADIERIGDHAENVAEYTRITKEQKVNFSKEGWSELHSIADKSLLAVDMAVELLRDQDLDKHLPQLEAIEQEVDRLQEQYVENHINRLKHIQCNPRGGVIFTDMISDLERCSDHAINVADCVAGRRWA